MIRFKRYAVAAVREESSNGAASNAVSNAAKYSLSVSLPKRIAYKWDERINYHLFL